MKIGHCGEAKIEKISAGSWQIIFPNGKVGWTRYKRDAYAAVHFWLRGEAERQGVDVMISELSWINCKPYKQRRKAVGG